jgi:hypothetical protein
MKQIAAALTNMPDVARVSPVATQNGISLIQLIPNSGPNDSATASLAHTLRDDRATIEGQTGVHILVGGTAVVRSKFWYHPEWFAKYVTDPDIEGQRLGHKLTTEELAAMTLSQDLTDVDFPIPAGRP